MEDGESLPQAGAHTDQEFFLRHLGRFDEGITPRISRYSAKAGTLTFDTSQESHDHL